MKLDRILVPTDLSEPSRRALEHAQSLRAALGGTITLIHVAPPPVHYLPLDEWIWGDDAGGQDLAGRVQKAANEALATFVADLPEALRAVASEVVLGIPGSVIVERAREGGFDLIVMATHGRTGAAKVLMGSVAERVVRAAPCPVLTLR